MGNRRTTGQARLWAGGIGMAAAAAAVIGMGTAHADTPDDVFDQAINYFNQGDAVLDTASTGDLGARSADLLSGQENLGVEAAQILPQFASLTRHVVPDRPDIAGRRRRTVGYVCPECPLG